MKQQRLSRFSPEQRVALSRQLKDAVEIDLIRPSHIDSIRQFCSCVKPMARFDCALTTVTLMGLRVRTPNPFRVWTTLLMK
jgi:hypothetical protein